MSWLPEHRHRILRLAKSLAEGAKTGDLSDFTCFYPGCGGNIRARLENDRLSWTCTRCSNGGSLVISPSYWDDREQE